MATKAAPKKRRLSKEGRKDVRTKDSSSLWQKIDGLIADIPAEEWSKLPKDGAKQIDHYLYGTPKQ